MMVVQVVVLSKRVLEQELCGSRSGGQQFIKYVTSRGDSPMNRR
jgi:hypothetical protein